MKRCHLKLLSTEVDIGTLLDKKHGALAAPKPVTFFFLFIIFICLSFGAFPAGVEERGVAFGVGAVDVGNTILVSFLLAALVEIPLKHNAVSIDC